MCMTSLLANLGFVVSNLEESWWMEGRQVLVPITTLKSFLKTLCLHLRK